MNADVHSIEDLDNVMKLENDDYPVDAVNFETLPELEEYKTKWQDYKKFCLFDYPTILCAVR